MRAYHRLSIAPMMQYTDRHYRYMMRLFTRHTLLYTEMVVGTTITHNLDRLERFLGYNPVEHPLAVQLGGDDPAVLKEAARACEDYGYDEINLNVGCPSDRVQKGRFGVCLMQDPERVAEVVAAMRSVVKIPVTVKHRIGVDNDDSYEFMARFVDIVRQSGCDLFIVHARKAWLKGLSPAQNRNVPPLRYPDVYKLKQEFPELSIIINGGVENLDQVEAHLEHCDGVMIGRAAYHQPQLFEAADTRIFGAPESEPPATEAILEAVTAYTHDQLARGVKLSFVAKHLVGLFKNRPGSRIWRQRISQLIQRNPAQFDFAAIYREAFHREPRQVVNA